MKVVAVTILFLFFASFGLQFLLNSIGLKSISGIVPILFMFLVGGLVIIGGISK